MANSTELELRVIARDEASKVLKQVENNADGFGKTLGKVGQIASGFIAANVVAGAAQKLTSFLGDSINEAVKLGESLNAVNKIFGTSAQTVLDWGKQNATSFGLSQQAFNQLATPLGAILKNAGLPLDMVADKTIELTKRAADMASVFNTDVNTALQAIMSGLKGEANPLEQFGVGLNAAKVEAEALAMTGKKTASSLTDVEKATARMNVIMRETASTQGDFTETSKELANAQRIQQARQEELQAQIGQHLIPLQLKWTEAKAKFVELLATKVLPAIEKFAAVLVPLIENIYSLLRTGKTIDEWRTQIDALPPSIQGVAEAVQKTAKFIHEHWPEIKKVFEFVAQVIKDKVEGSIQVIRGIYEVVSSTVNLVKAVVHGDWSTAWNELKDIAGAAIQIFVGVVQTTLAGVFDKMVAAVRSAVNEVIKIINAAIRAYNALPLGSGVEVGQIGLIGSGPTGGGGYSNQEVMNEVNDSGGYASTTRYIPRDMWARVHQGEVVSRPGVNEGGSGTLVLQIVNANGGIDAVVAKVRRILEDESAGRTTSARTAGYSVAGGFS